MPLPSEMGHDMNVMSRDAGAEHTKLGLNTEIVLFSANSLLHSANSLHEHLDV